MAHRWEDLKHKVSDKRRAEIAERAQEEVRRLSLNQLREARSLTQTNLAEKLQVNQGAVSKIEKRADMYVSTLRGYVEAMGGRLEIRAVFPDGEVVIEQFGKLVDELFLAQVFVALALVVARAAAAVVDVALGGAVLERLVFLLG